MPKLEKNNLAPDFTYNTAYENGKNFFAQLSEKGNVLMFSRYIGCSLCQVKLMEMNADYKKFQTEGINVFFVLQSRSETTKPKLDELNIPFDVILDTDEEIYKLYEVGAAKNKAGLVSPKVLGMIKNAKDMGIEHGEYEGNELQLPAVFVLDSKGSIKLAHYAKNLGDLPSTDEIINAAR